jgi:hypothetical protein
VVCSPYLAVLERIARRTEGRATTQRSRYAEGVPLTGHSTHGQCWRETRLQCRGLRQISTTMAIRAIHSLLKSIHRCTLKKVLGNYYYEAWRYGESSQCPVSCTDGYGGLPPEDFIPTTVSEKSLASPSNLEEFAIPSTTFAK